MELGRGEKTRKKKRKREKEKIRVQAGHLFDWKHKNNVFRLQCMRYACL